MSDPAALTPTERVRIAFCITELDVGGAEKAFVQLLLGLDHSRFEPHVFCLSEPGELVEPLEQAGIPVTCFHRRGWQTVRTLPRLIREFKSLRPIIVQSFLFQANFLGRLAAWRAKIPVMIPGERVAEQRGNWRNLLDRLTQKLVTRYVAVSNSVAVFLNESRKIPLEKIETIPNGVDFATFRQAQKLDLTTLGIPQGSRVLLSVGRLDYQKAPELLLEAVCGLLKTRPEIHLIFAGDGPERETLERMIGTKNLTGQVHLIGKRPDIPELLKTAELLIFPSRWEGMPNVILEAMAAGTPIISTRVEGVEELLQDQVSGRLIPVENVPALRQAVEEFLTNPAPASEWAVIAQNIVEERFTWQTMVKNYEQLYTEILKTTGKPFKTGDN